MTAQRHVLGMRVDALSGDEASSLVLRWATQGLSSYVCAANVHMVMETFDSGEFRRVVNEADLTVPDGRPLVWALKALGEKGASHVRGADLMLRVAERAAGEGMPVGFYGGTPETLEGLIRVLKGRLPSLEIACRLVPPFRALTPEEDESLTAEIAASGARILFVGLGCPKQENWMAAHKGRIPAVMLGVGAAFDFHAGSVRQAPRWMQGAGLEWLFRLIMEPRRLWRRYARHNSRFMALFTLQMLGPRRFGDPSPGKDADRRN